jgi:hypothetical protein
MPATTPEAKKRKNRNAYLKHKEKIKNDEEYRVKYTKRKWERHVERMHTDKDYNKAYNAKRYNPVNRMFLSAKKRAQRKGLEFNLKREDLIIPETCPIFGIPLEFGDVNHLMNSPSLDRIDNSKGYTPENIWIISYRANTIKNNATLEELKVIVKAVEEKMHSLCNNNP